jgi:5-methyltetrahydropteroyltriglutamate--homocysteine methyltransferase
MTVNPPLHADIVGSSLRSNVTIGLPADHPMFEHDCFLHATTGVTPKVSIPAPTALHFCLENGARDPAVYADAEDTFDDTAWAYLCRGNSHSTWIPSGGCEPVAEELLAVCNYDGYFLEYDSDRAGTFEPLLFLPKMREFAEIAPEVGS